VATGTDLKIERVRAGLTMKQVAERMGISRQSLWAIERQETVDPTREAEYRAALLARTVKGDAA
jgi:transcriptional regulator with XRE-family HTH domain